MNILQVLNALVASDLDSGTVHDFAPDLKLHVLRVNHIAITRKGKQVRRYWTSYTLPPVVPQEFFDKLK